MIRLRVLGALDLRDEDGTAITSVLAQPKRVALATFLALAGAGSFQRRDTLLNVFWPDSDTDHARHALRQAIYFLRRSLGEDAILSRGDEELGLDPGKLSCDAAVFSRLLDEGRLEEGLAEYGGDLLPGFHLGDAPDFVEWLETERTLLRRRAVDACGKLSARLAAEGRPSDALGWARRRATLAPAEADPVHALMELLVAMGDVASALEAYRDHEQRVAAEFDLTPEANLQEFAARLRSSGTGGGLHLRPSDAAPEGVPGRSLRPAAPEPVAEGGMAAGDGAPAGPELPVAVRRRLRPFLTAAAVLGLAGVLFLRLARPERTFAGESIAVFPFRVISPDSTIAYLGAGMAELVGVAFEGEQVPRAVDMDVVTRARQQEAGAPEEPLHLTAARLGARLYVSASLIAVGDDVVVDATLAESRTGGRVGTARVNGPLDSFPVLAHRLAVELIALATGHHADLERSSDAPYAAIRPWMRGQAAYRSGDFYAAEAFFKEALRTDSAFAPAAFGLLLASSWTGSWIPEPAWRLREALPARDRDYVVALFGEQFPGPSWSAVHDVEWAISRWRDYLQRWGDRTEAWYELGDRYLHGGAVAGIADHLDRAEAAFRKSLAVDASFGPAHLHLIDVMVEQQVRAPPGTTSPEAHSRLSRTASRYFTESARGSRYTSAAAWRTATHLGDEVWLRQIRDSLGAMPRFELHKILWATQRYGWPQGDAERALVLLERTATNSAVWLGVITERYALELNRGRPAAARRAADAMQQKLPDRPLHLLMRVQAALLGEGDTADAARAAAALERVAAEPRPTQLSRRHEQQLATFHAAAWKLFRGDTAGARSSASALRAALLDDPETASLRPLGEFYVAYLEALLAAVAGRSDGLALALAADSILRRHWGDVVRPWRDEWVLQNTGHVLMMRLHERRGDDARALEAARRQSLGLRNGASFLSTRLLAEAHYAARAGDSAAARRAAAHYAALRRVP